MSLPYFFTAAEMQTGNVIGLEEETSKHIVQVLRMEEGEKLQLTDGRGHQGLASVATAHKKQCVVRLEQVLFSPRESPLLTIAISPLKNASRLEWFMEKATELGAAAIIPMICNRTERTHLRADRLENICRSAMLQSGQIWLPGLSPAKTFREVISEVRPDQRFIAHCGSVPPPLLTTVYDPARRSTLVLIGPEGDFTSEEVSVALASGFEPVSLGRTRLRTETAGVYAAAICR